MTNTEYANYLEEEYKFTKVKPNSSLAPQGTENIFSVTIYFTNEQINKINSKMKRINVISRQAETDALQINPARFGAAAKLEYTVSKKTIEIVGAYDTIEIFLLYLLK